VTSEPAVDRLAKWTLQWRDERNAVEGSREALLQLRGHRAISKERDIGIEDLPVIEIEAWLRRSRENNIHVARTKRRDELLLCSEGARDADGSTFHELAKNGLHGRRDDRCFDTNPQNRLGRGTECTFELEPECEDSIGVLKRDTTLRCDLHALRRAIKQLNTERIFERLDLRAERRWRKTKPL